MDGFNREMSDRPPRNYASARRPSPAKEGQRQQAKTGAIQTDGARGRSHRLRSRSPFWFPMEYSAVYLKSWGASPLDLERHLGTVREISKEMILGIGEQLEIVRREEQGTARS